MLSTGILKKRVKSIKNLIMKKTMLKNQNRLGDVDNRLDIIRMFCPRTGLHCKRRNLGYSSAEGMCSIPNSGTKAAILLGIQKAR